MGDLLSQSGLASEAGGQKTILVVDNERGILQLAHTILQLHGYRVLTAEDGQRAVEIYRQNLAVINVVLIDQNMPGLSGLETIDELLALNPRLRVLLMTGGSPPEPSGGAKTAGWCFLSKPWSTDQLVQAVRDVLEASMKEEG